MATINYPFADGHIEEIEVTEEAKTAYEELKQQEKRYYWKTKSQKYRAGLRSGRDCSLELCTEHGYEPQSSAPSPLDELILREEQAAYDKKLLSRLTPNQREVYVLRHIQGFSIAFCPRISRGIKPKEIIGGLYDCKKQEVDSATARA